LLSNSPPCPIRGTQTELTWYTAMPKVDVINSLQDECGKLLDTVRRLAQGSHVDNGKDQEGGRHLFDTGNAPWGDSI
jgi:hypothetical protein